MDSKSFAAGVLVATVAFIGLRSTRAPEKQRSSDSPESVSAAPTPRPSVDDYTVLRETRAYSSQGVPVTVAKGAVVKRLRDEKGYSLVELGSKSLWLPNSSFQPLIPVVESPTGATTSAASNSQALNLSAGVAQFSKWLLVVEGDTGEQGSGAIILLSGKPVIVTNIHVVDGCKKVRFRRLDSVDLPFTSFEFSKTHDIAVAGQNQITSGFPMMEDVASNVAVGDDVLVLGNSQGGRVVTEIQGKVTGIGPDLIETDAKFVEGNSGSPIVHVKSGKVIGIATFAQIRRLTTLSADSKFNEVRRFGYRLDTLKTWDRTKWEHFVSQGQRLEEIRRLTDQLVALAFDIHRDGTVDLAEHQAPGNEFRLSVNEFLRVLESPATTAKADIYNAKGRFLREVQFIAMRDISAGRPNGFTAWHQKKFEDELFTRKLVASKISEWMNYQDADRKIRLP